MHNPNHLRYSGPLIPESRSITFIWKLRSHPHPPSQDFSLAFPAHRLHPCFMRKDDFDMPKPPRGHEWHITPGSTGGWVERGTPAVTITLRNRWTKQPVAWRGSEMSDEAIPLAAQWLLCRVEQDKRFAEARRRDIDAKAGRWLGVWR